MHKTVLAGSSLYFRTTFGPKWNSREISVTVTQEEVDPFNVLIRFFYFGCINEPNLLSVSFLLHMLRLSDRFLAEQATLAIKEAIQNCPVRIFRADIVLFYSENAEIFQDLALKSMFEGALVTELHILDSIFLAGSCKQRQSFFLNLPLRAIVNFFSQGSMLVSSENMILKLVLQWCAANPHEVDTLDVLRKCIRVGSLSFSVINEFLDKISWMNFDVNQKNMMLAYITNIQSNPTLSFDVPAFSNAHSIPNIWFSKRQYIVQDCIPFILKPVILPIDFLEKKKTMTAFPVSNISWNGLSFTFGVSLDANGQIFGEAQVIFVIPNESKSPNDSKYLTVSVTYTVTIGNVQVGPFQQLTGHKVQWHAGNGTGNYMSIEELRNIFGLQEDGLKVSVVINDAKL